MNGIRVNDVPVRSTTLRFGDQIARSRAMSTDDPIVPTLVPMLSLMRSRSRFEASPLQRAPFAHSGWDDPTPSRTNARVRRVAGGMAPPRASHGRVEERPWRMRMRPTLAAASRSHERARRDLGDGTSR
jgi:hypothetical protein